MGASLRAKTSTLPVFLAYWQGKWQGVNPQCNSGNTGEIDLDNNFEKGATKNES